MAPLGDGKYMKKRPLVGIRLFSSIAAAYRVGIASHPMWLMLCEVIAGEAADALEPTERSRTIDGELITRCVLLRDLKKPAIDVCSVDSEKRALKPVNLGDSAGKASELEDLRDHLRSPLDRKVRLTVLNS